MPPGPTRKDAMARALTDPGTFATTLTTILLDAFGTEALAWHPATVALEVEAAFGVALPGASYDRLMAGVALVTTDRFYKDPDAFKRIASVLSGGRLDPGTVALPGAAECAWGITEALLLGPPEAGDDAPFVADIVRYIAMVLDREGILAPPDVLAIGVRHGGSDRLAAALAAYADTASIRDAIAAVEARRTAAINATIRTGLATLIGQVAALELDDGNARALLARLSRGVDREG